MVAAVTVSASVSISVITVTRNAAVTLPALHESLERQKYRQFEWIVADGASTDSTVQLLQECASRSPWLHYFSEPDFGVYHALNKAIARSSGTWYVVAGADDVFAPDALENYAEVASTGTADVVLACVRRNGRVIGGFHPNKAWVGTSRVFRGSHSIGMLFRTDLHASFGWYSRRFPLLADVHFLKLLLRSGRVRFVESDFVAGTFAEGGLTTTNKLQILAENWQIQMLTEPSPLLQIALFLGKVAIRYPALLKELATVRRASLKTPPRHV